MPNCRISFRNFDPRHKAELIHSHNNHHHWIVYCKSCSQLFDSPAALTAHSDRHHPSYFNSAAHSDTDFHFEKQDHVSYCHRCLYRQDYAYQCRCELAGEINERLRESRKKKSRYDEYFDVGDFYERLRESRKKKSRYHEYFDAGDFYSRDKYCDEGDFYSSKEYRDEAEFYSRYFEEPLKKDSDSTNFQSSANADPSDSYNGSWTDDYARSESCFDPEEDDYNSKWFYPDQWDDEESTSSHQHHTDSKPKPKAKEPPPPPPPSPAKAPAQDYYTLISVLPTATQAEIRKAIKKARIAHHPDRFMTQNLSPEALAEVVERAKCVGQACDVLEDPAARSMYDAELASESRTSKASSASSNPSSYDYNSRPEPSSYYYHSRPEPSSYYYNSGPEPDFASYSNNWHGRAYGANAHKPRSSAEKGKAKEGYQERSKPSAAQSKGKKPGNARGRKAPRWAEDMDDY